MKQTGVLADMEVAENKKMPTVKKIFPVDLFKRGVMVFFGSRERMKSYLTKEWGYDWDEDTDKILDRSEAGTFRLDTDTIIFSERPVDEEILVHEIVHAASHILRLVDVDDEEALAYLVEYLYGKIIPWARTTSFWASGDAPSE